MDSHFPNHLRTKCSHIIKRTDGCLGHDVKRDGAADADDTACMITLRIASFDENGSPIEADRLQVDDIKLVINGIDCANTLASCRFLGLKLNC